MNLPLFKYAVIFLFESHICIRHLDGPLYHLHLHLHLLVHPFSFPFPHATLHLHADLSALPQLAANFEQKLTPQCNFSFLGMDFTRRVATRLAYKVPTLHSFPPSLYLLCVWNCSTQIGTFCCCTAFFTLAEKSKQIILKSNI